MDGAGRWKQMLHVTLPGIMPMVAVLTVLGLGGILNAGFEQILIMYNPTVEKTVDILDTLVYRLGMVSHQYSAAAAMGLFKSVISLLWEPATGFSIRRVITGYFKGGVTDENQTFKILLCVSGF